MEKFTRREIDVLYLLLKGMSNVQISENLCISNHTTKAHVASIFRKLNVSNRVQAAVKCFGLNQKRSSIEDELIAEIKKI